MSDKFEEVKTYWEAEREVIAGLLAQGAIIEGEEARRIDHKTWLIEEVLDLRADIRRIEKDIQRYMGERDEARRKIEAARVALGS